MGLGDAAAAVGCTALVGEVAAAVLARRARRFKKAFVSGRSCRDPAPSKMCSPETDASCRTTIWA